MRGTVAAMSKQDVTVQFAGRQVTLRPCEFTRYRKDTGVLEAKRTQIPVKLCYAVTGEFYVTDKASFFLITWFTNLATIDFR